MKDRCMSIVMFLCLLSVGPALLLNADGSEPPPAVPFPGNGSALPGSPYAAEPKKAELLDESGELALFAGETEADADSNENDHTEGSMDYRNSLFLRLRTKGGKCEWRLLMTSGGGWKDADMDEWCKDRARDARGCLYVQRAKFSKDRRAVWMVCDPHIGTYSVVCSLDLAENTFRVLIDGFEADEQVDGTILVREKKTYLEDENGEPLGAAWYDLWMTRNGTVVRRTKPSRATLQEGGSDDRRYVLEYETEKLRKEFEKEWMRHVAGYTNRTAAGRTDERRDMAGFIRKWKPRILRNQVYKENDPAVRVKMADWMVKENSIDSIYYGMLMPHAELAWAAYDSVANVPAKVNGVELQFKDGRATWKNRNCGDCEMTALIRRHYVWSRDKGEVFAFILTDTAANINDTSGGVRSDALADYWLVHYRGGRFFSSRKLPYKDVERPPSMKDAPYGRKYTLLIQDKKVEVANCVTGEIVLAVEE